MPLISQCEATYRGDIEVDQRPGDYFVSAVDGGGWFYAWGTCRLETGSGKLGALQKRGWREIS